MYGCESWIIKKAVKNWCFWTVVLKKTLESPLDCKEIQPVHSKGNQSWIFIGSTDAEAETPVLWPPDVNNWLIGKDTDTVKDWRQEEKGVTEGEMVGWHHWLDGHEFEQALAVDDGQGGLVCCTPWGHKELDRIERLNWTELRLPCPSLSPWVCSNSCPLSHWCHPTISPSTTAAFFCFQSFPASGSFPMSWLFTSGGQSIVALASASVLPVNIQSWFLLGLCL